tara:strand:+ start:1341 stop:1613 length:273 start_codon:yes stop_codon:yes gene_type:complete
MEFTCIECENLYDDTDGDTDERMCNKCIEEITNQEYSYTEDRKRVADRSVKKIRKMAIYKDATREECLEGIVYEMAAKIDELKITLDMVV